MKYRCLVFDHDDTVVNSTATIHYPCFVEFMEKYFPDYPKMSLEDYVYKNFDPGVIPLFREIIGMTEEEMKMEQDYWYAYAKKRTARAYDGMKEIMEKAKELGVITAVVSHSFSENILRDYKVNQLPVPDLIFGWEEPAEKRKPHPDSLYTIMEKYQLKPEEILVIDDLKPGCDMANEAHVPFAAAGWAFQIPEMEQFMRKNSTLYFKTVKELRSYLFEENE